MAKHKKRKQAIRKTAKKFLNYEVLFTLFIVLPLGIISIFFYKNEFNYNLARQIIESLTPTAYEHDTSIHFIDVGQADATLIEQDGEFCLIDTGTADADELILYLQSENVTQIDLLILTHHHADHIGGAVDVMQSFEIGEVWMFDYEKAGRPDNVTVLRTLEYIDISGIPDKSPKIGEVFSLGDGEIEVLHAGQTDYDNANNTSIVTAFEIGDVRFLSCGDAEQEQIDEMLENSVDVRANIYKAAHHGSKTSNSIEFLQVITPEFVAVSCGLENSYGHPHEEALIAFESVNAAVYGTNVNGNIVLSIENGEFNIMPEKDYDFAA